MRSLVALAIALAAASLSGHQQPASDPPTDDELSIQLLMQAVETALSTTDRDAWLAVLSANADRVAAAEFFDAMVPQGVTRAIVRARDRQPLAGALPGEGYRLVAEILIETGARARIATWRLDIRRPRGTTERQPWRVISQEKLSSVEGLHNLALHPEKQFTVSNLIVKSVDYELRLASGDVFVAETAEGVTALVLLGEGTMTFTPTPAEERGQVRLYAGADTLETPFNAAYLRMNPFDFDQQVKRQTLTPVARDGRTFRRAQLLFDEMVGKSFSLDLQDLSRETWSLLPQIGDFLAEVRTRRFGTLTFARSTNEAEDITLFSRERKRNISVYASEMKLSSRGRFFNEDDLVEYDVLDYEITAAFAPSREWIDGRTRLRLRIKAYALGALTLKLAENFNVSSVSSDQLGPLLFLRVRSQNSFVVNLPTPVARDMELTLTVAYSGRITPQALEQETVSLEAGQRSSEDVPYVPAEPRFLYSNRNQWYPQGQVTDYATATLRLSVPADYGIVASGLLMNTEPVRGSGGDIQQIRYEFRAPQPVRYLGVVISRFTRVDASTVALDIVPPPLTPTAPKAAFPAVGTRNTVALSIEANKRQEQRGRDLMSTAAEIFRFYAATVGDVPYDGMTVAMVEDELPGGHSPGYFAVINNPLPVKPFVWRNDPASFNNFPEFFVAHELAHQWWGQAVGWKNYHEQWLSEGFAQYFAAMYARERRGEPAFRDVIRQLRRWALDQSDQGAVYLGYRLGHIKGDSRVFRALVYNKGAGVLHMLRRLLGDEAFFRGVRRFYSENRFKKAGTEDLQRAMERESNRDLNRFFERWIYESGIPRVRYSTSQEGQDLIVRFEQVTAAPDGVLYDIPVTVTIQTVDGTVEEVVAITQAVVEKRITLASPMRNVEINADGAALAIFDRR
jgi:hypothetical protein